jgi:lipoyl-dependent peroxiredoxin
METVSTKTLREMRSEHPNLLVVNVLEEKDYDEMHLPKSVCIPVDDVDFVERVRDAVDGDLDIPIVVYCSDESCPKSEFAAERLEAAGFEKVLDFEGGVKAWKNNDLPLEGTKVNGNDPSRKSKSAKGEKQTESKEKREGKASEEKAAKESKAEEKQQKGKKKSKEAEDKAEEKSKDQADEEAEEKSEEGARAKEESESKSENDGKKKKKEAAGKEKKKPKAKSKAKSDESKEKSKSAFKREAAAEWQGMLKDGTGRMMLGSASGVSIPYTFAKRFGDEDGANTEELLGAALAGCFSMALSSEIGNAGYNVDRLKTGATVHLSKSGDGFAVSRIDLEVAADVNEIDADEFQELADTAKDSCPISKALDGIEIRLKATLNGDV